MGVQVLTNVKLWLDGRDLSGDMNALAITHSASLRDATTLNDLSIRRIPGLGHTEFQHEGFFEAGSGQVDPDLFGKIGASDSPMSVAPAGEADGNLGYTFKALLAQYIPGGAIDDAFKFSVSGEGGSERLVRGTIMHNATRTTTGNGVARQLGAVAAGQKLYAALHVLSATGTLDVIVQSDDAVGMASPTSRVTFAQATAVGGQFLTAAGAISDDYWRVSYTIGGGSPSFKFIVVLGIK